jgi:hypothetical protein
MLSKQESSDLNKRFWGELHMRMRSHKSSNGRSISWLNYPSDVKGIYIRMLVDKRHAAVQFDMQFKDESIREIVWEQMEELKKVMELTMEIEGYWRKDIPNAEGNTINQIAWELNDVNLYNEKDHEKIYSFLQTTIVKFDLFYQEFKEILVGLVH